jgi:hypothetical protein
MSTMPRTEVSVTLAPGTVLIFPLSDGVGWGWGAIFLWKRPAALRPQLRAVEHRALGAAFRLCQSRSSPLLEKTGVSDDKSYG